MVTVGLTAIPPAYSVFATLTSDFLIVIAPILKNLASVNVVFLSANV